MASSPVFKVFCMTLPEIEPRSPGPLANTLPTRPMKYMLIEQKIKCYQSLPSERFYLNTLLHSIVAIRYLSA